MSDHERRFRVPGDENSELIEIQEQCYPALGPTILREAAKALYLAEQLTEASSRLGASFGKTDKLDTWPQLMAYRAIGAGFRKLRQDLSQSVLEFIDDQPHEGRLLQEWTQFLHSQLKELCGEPDFVRAILTACTYGSSDEGQSAADYLANFLQQRYGLIANIAGTNDCHLSYEEATCRRLNRSRERAVRWARERGAAWVIECTTSDWKWLGTEDFRHYASCMTTVEVAELLAKQDETVRGHVAGVFRVSKPLDVQGDGMPASVWLKEYAPPRLL